MYTNNNNIVFFTVCMCIKFIIFKHHHNPLTTTLFVSVKTFSINTFKNFNFQTKVNHTQSVSQTSVRIIIITWVCMACSHHYHLGMYGLFSSSPGYVWPVFIITRVCIACFHHHLGMYQVFASSHGCLQGARIITRVFINSNY